MLPENNGFSLTPVQKMMGGKNFTLKEHEHHFNDKTYNPVKLRCKKKLELTL